MHPTDAALLQAWERYRVVVCQLELLPNNVSDKQRRSIDRSLLQLDHRLATLRVNTLQGVAIKLRYCVAALDGGVAVEAAALKGEPLPLGQPRDYRLRALWRLIGDIDRMIARG